MTGASEPAAGPDRGATPPGVRASSPAGARTPVSLVEPTEQLRLSGLTRLRFDDAAVERQFRADYLLKTLGPMRFALGSGIALYLLFGLLDPLVIPPADLAAAQLIRFGVVTPLLLVGLLLLYLPRARGSSLLVASATLVVAGLGLIAIIHVTDDVASRAYFAGFLLIDMFIYTVMQLPFVHATCIGWVIFVVYDVFAAVHGVSSDDLLWHDFFMVGGNFGGMVGAWFIERLRRRDFAAQLVLARDRAKLVELTDELEILSQRDPLTGLLNRRHLDGQLGHLIEMHHRYGVDASLVLVDLDDFKVVNDTHGHPVGDALLVACASAVKDCIRAADLAFRYGGDEFLVLAPKTSTDVAVPIAERIKAAFAELRVPGMAGRVGVSCSIGIACVRPADRVATDALATVDEALYRAKRAGKAQVVVIPEAKPLAGD